MSISAKINNYCKTIIFAIYYGENITFRVYYGETITFAYYYGVSIIFSIYYGKTIMKWFLFAEIFIYEVGIRECEKERKTEVRFD